MTDPTRASYDGAQLSAAPSEIELLGGTFFNYLDATPDDLNITDIIGSLAKLCRYIGHVKRFYSVAEHTWLVVELLRELDADVELQRAGLLHDAAEAYTGDTAAPLKFAARVLEYARTNRCLLTKAVEDIRGCQNSYNSTPDAIAGDIDDIIAERFNVNPELFRHPQVIQADLWALRLEAAQLTHSGGRNWRWPDTDDHPIYQHWPGRLVDAYGTHTGSGFQIVTLGVDWQEAARRMAFHALELL